MIALSVARIIVVALALSIAISPVAARSTAGTADAAPRAITARVTLADQTSYRAELVGVFPDRDLAVLRIRAPAD